MHLCSMLCVVMVIGLSQACMPGLIIRSVF